MTPTTATFLAALALLAGCDSGIPTAGECAAPNSIAIVVTVIDSVTGDSIADSASGTVTAGAYSDSLRLDFESSGTLLGGNQLGTYAVALARPGYAAWGRTGVAVTHKGPCGNVEPVELHASLQPTP